MTPSHGVEKCALFVAGLKKVENVNIMMATCLFMAKSREACSALLVNSPPPRAASIGGRLVAGDVGSQVLSLAGFEVIQQQVPPGSHVLLSGLAAAVPHIGEVELAESGLIINIHFVT